MIFAHFLWFWRCKKCVFDWQGRQNMHCRENQKFSREALLGLDFFIFESILEPKSWKMPSGKVAKKTSMFAMFFFCLGWIFIDFRLVFNSLQTPKFGRNRIQMNPKSLWSLLFGFFIIYYDFEWVFDFFLMFFWIFLKVFFFLIGCFFGVFR